MTQISKYIIFTAILGFTLLFSSCTKEVPKEMMNTNKQPVNNQQMPNDSIHKNLGQNSGQDQNQTGVSDKNDDPKADELNKAADEADAKYQKTKSDADKKIAIQKQMDAANYLTYGADLSPKKKYRPALQRYRRVLELEPGNEEAAANKKQIEDIYQSMGMPIP